MRSDSLPANGLLAYILRVENSRGTNGKKHSTLLKELFVLASFHNPGFVCIQHFVGCVFI